MRKRILNAINYTFFFLFLSSLFLYNLSFGQTKKAKETESYFKASASYLSNAVYNGRQDSLVTPYITPSLGYYDKTGFYIFYT